MGNSHLRIMVKVDLTAYVEKHEFCFDAVLDEYVTNDEVISSSVISLCWDFFFKHPLYIVLISLKFVLSEGTVAKYFSCFLLYIP